MRRLRARQSRVSRRRRMPSVAASSIRMLKDGRMQMQVQMAVDVVERQAGGAEFFKLRVDFRAELFAQVVFEKIAHADADRVIAEFTLRVDEAGNFFRRQGGIAAEQSQMQANAEPWIFPRQSDGFVAGGFIHHQAGGGQNAFAVRADDGFIDGMRQAEIVRVDDEAAAGGRSSEFGVRS